MKPSRKVLIGIIGIFLLYLLCQCFVWLYIFVPWAVPWVGNFIYTNPPKPETTYGEFEFQLIYEFNGEQHDVHDSIVCQFDGYTIKNYDGKQRSWKKHYKKEAQYEFFSGNPDKHFDPMILLENIDQYKLLLNPGGADYFLADPDSSSPGNPPIFIFDTKSGYFIDPIKMNQFLENHNVKIIQWSCDPPIKNSFN